MPVQHKNVLIIEDDKEINLLLTKMLHKLPVHITNAYAGTEGLLYLEREEYDLVLLDLMLPGMDGEDVLKKVRETSDVPILILSAKSSLHDKVSLLKAGADDYITKPFHQEEVLARVEVQLRRSSPKEKQEDGIIRYESIEMNTYAREVKVEGQELVLTVSEYDILHFLLTYPKRAFSKKDIYEAVGKGMYIGDDNTVSVHISNIRKKIATLTEREYIKTVWGIGFMLE